MATALPSKLFRVGTSLGPRLRKEDLCREFELHMKRGVRWVLSTSLFGPEVWDRHIHGQKAGEEIWHLPSISQLPSEIKLSPDKNPGAHQGRWFLLPKWDMPFDDFATART